MQKKFSNDEIKSRINIDFDDTTLIPQLIGVNNCNLREIEGNVDVEVDSNGSMINLYGKRKNCLVAKEIIEKSYIKLKNYRENNVEFNEFSINTDIKNVISKKLKNYPLPLVDESTARKEAAKKIYNIRNSKTFKEQSKNIYMKHGSRKINFKNKSRKLSNSKNQLSLF